jgi:hypothetical protein
MVMKRTKIRSRVPEGPEIKNNCAGEDQQKFTPMLCYASDSADCGKLVVAMRNDRYVPRDGEPRRAPDSCNGPLIFRRV